MYPRQSPTTHTEQLGDEASVYDWARAQVHALNPMAARVWRRCDGATTPEAIAAELARDMIPEAEAVVALTLREFVRLHLLESHGESHADRRAPGRRWLLSRGVAAAMLPVIYSIAAPSPVEAQSPGRPPTLTAITPLNGDPGSTIDVTLTGTGFGTTVAVSGTGVTPSNIRDIDSTSLLVTFTVAVTATPGPRNVTVTTAGGTSNALIFTVNPPTPGAPTLTNITPNQGVQGTTVAVTLTGTNFVAGATTVNVSGSGVTVNTVVVGSSTSLTANFVLDAAAASGARGVTVTTAGGPSGPVSFTVNPLAPTLTNIAPNQGVQSTTVAVTLAGTNFVVGATTVNVGGSGVTVNTVVVGSSTSLTANFVLDAAAAPGARNVTVTTAGGTSGPVSFTINLPAPTLTGVAPNQGLRGTTIAVTLTGTNFVIGATTVAVTGGDVTVNTVVVGSSTSLTANFVPAPASLGGARTVTVTTAGGTSGPQTFTVTLPPPGIQSFVFAGSVNQTFTVPAGVVSILIEATGARGGSGLPPGSDNAGNGGRAVARVSVLPGTVLTVRVGGVGQDGADGVTAAGGFNGGGGTLGFGAGGGGGATSVYDGATPLVIGGGGGGAGRTVSGLLGDGGRGGGLIAEAGESAVSGVAGGGGTQSVGGVAGLGGTNGVAGSAGAGGTGGANVGTFGGGGGGGGYFGGGGGGATVGGGGGGGGGSSFTAPGATEVLHQQGSGFSSSVLISW